MTTSDVVIRVEGLGKTTSLHHEQSERTTTLRDVVDRRAKAAGRLLEVGAFYWTVLAPDHFWPAAARDAPRPLARP